MLLVTNNVTRSSAHHIFIGYNKLGALASGCFPEQNNILAEFLKKIN